jgi:hypothetical protein
VILPKVDVVFAGDEEAAIAVGPIGDPMGLAHRISERGPHVWKTTVSGVSAGSRRSPASAD